MISFPNAKLNIGLRITERRPDGYHNLETLFVPVGLYAGTPVNPVSFCDTLEITPSETDRFIFSGRPVDCPTEKNLVYRAVETFREAAALKGIVPFAVQVFLEKHLPDGAGLGGGSADASFALKLLNELGGFPFSDEELSGLVLRLGADCPFFIANRPAYGEGIGERLTPVYLNLDGWWCVIVKPRIHVSTREAFAGIVPRSNRKDSLTDRDEYPLYRLGEIPVEDWRDIAVNDFESTLFPLYPELSQVKERLYDLGARYTSMSGSGSSLFGLFSDEASAAEATDRLISSTPLKEGTEGVWSLKL